MFGLMREGTHRRLLLDALTEVEREWLSDLQAANALSASARSECERLRRENLDLRNEIARLRGEKIAEAHANGNPAPNHDA